ncbi:MAG TPA: helix-turn-helix transcriptional regulator, partial [Streptosporangiaceae bacterium]|nr:helix-turn-helix transcriptional regulator [Streptosporangiaceae bacterium]
MVSRDFDPDGTPLGLFGAELRFYRAQAGLTKTELGARVYLSADLISAIENGKRAPTQEVTDALDAVPELDTRGALRRLREHLKDRLKYQATPGWTA